MGMYMDFKNLYLGTFDYSNFQKFPSFSSRALDSQIDFKAIIFCPRHLQVAIHLAVFLSNSYHFSILSSKLDLKSRAAHIIISGSPPTSLERYPI